MTSPNPRTHGDLIDELMREYGNDSQILRVNQAYYKSGYRPKAIGLAVPPAMKKLLVKIGWPRLYIDSLEERLTIEGFRMPNGDAAKDLWQWWQYNKLDLKSGLGHKGALVHGRSFITIAQSQNPLLRRDIPVIRVESAKNMHVDIDPITDLVRAAVRPYKDKRKGTDDRVTLYTQNGNFGYVRGPAGQWIQEWKSEHNLGYATVVPIVNQVDLDEPLGESEITSELRSVTDAAARLMMDMQATAELMAIPQRVIFGLEEEEVAKITGEKSWDAYIARILAFTNGEGKIDQYAAAELRNFADGLDVLRREAGSYTGLPSGYMSFSADNPASAEAIKASESRLVQKASRKITLFGEPWELAMHIALRVMRKSVPDDIHMLETVWKNPATPTFAAEADAMTKLVSTPTADGTSLVPAPMARRKLGFSEVEQQEMEEMDRKAPKNRLADLFGQATPPTFSDRSDRE